MLYCQYYMCFLLVGSFLTLTLTFSIVTQLDLSRDGSCSLQIVESIPQNLTYPSGTPNFTSTYDAWTQLLNLATTTVDIASFYWTLLGSDTNTIDDSTLDGENIFNLVKTTAKRGVKFRIVYSATNKPSNDISILTTMNLFEIRSLNMSRLIGAGILHTKLIIIDNKHMYIGSANMDWRSLTQVKELGIFATNCPNLVADTSKLFSVYWQLSLPDAIIPKQWPSSLYTNYNITNPLKTVVNGNPNTRLYIASSPNSVCPNGRSTDVEALLQVIRAAEKFIWIAVMDYMPAIIYNGFHYWPVIDDELRKAAIERGLQVRMLNSKWTHMKWDMPKYMCSLQAVNGTNRRHGSLELRLFTVPFFSDAQKKIPYARVNHNKYMVTDNAAYIGTSNWTGDYFTSTAGASITVNQTSTTSGMPSDIQNQLSEIFLRDWNSEYSTSVEYPYCNYG